MIRKIRILIWQFISNLEQILYPYEREDAGDYYYTVKNEETGENYMIIEWIKSFDERIQRLQDEMLYVQSELRRIKEND